MEKENEETVVKEGDESTEEKETKKREKELAKQKRMLEKKFAQGVTTLEKMEKKKIGEIVSNEPSLNVIFIYFGVKSV